MASVKENGGLDNLAFDVSTITYASLKSCACELDAFQGILVSCFKHAVFHNVYLHSMNSTNCNVY